MAHGPLVRVIDHLSCFVNSSDNPDEEEKITEAFSFEEVQESGTESEESPKNITEISEDSESYENIEDLEYNEYSEESESEETHEDLD